MSMKPTELGCLVTITDSSAADDIGLCGAAVAMERDVRYPGCYWQVSTTGKFHNQKCLMRIDGGEDESLTAEEGQEVSA